MTWLLRKVRRSGDRNTFTPADVIGLRQRAAVFKRHEGTQCGDGRPTAENL